MRKLTFRLLLAACSLLSLSLTPVPTGYIQSLLFLNGTPYETLNCSEYICAAKHHRFCSAHDFWSNGCGGDAIAVQDVTRFEDIDQSELQLGDVAAFHGVHVAAYVGNGIWIDSDFLHGGVGVMQRNQKPGGWFVGEVKILRWRI